MPDAIPQHARHAEHSWYSRCLSQTCTCLSCSKKPNQKCVRQELTATCEEDAPCTSCTMAGRNSRQPQGLLHLQHSHLLNSMSCDPVITCKHSQVACREGAHLLHRFSGEHTKDDRHARVLTSAQQPSSSSIGYGLIVRGGTPHLCTQTTSAADTAAHTTQEFLTMP